MCQGCQMATWRGATSHYSPGALSPPAPPRISYPHPSLVPAATATTAPPGIVTHRPHAHSAATPLPGPPGGPYGRLPKNPHHGPCMKGPHIDRHIMEGPDEGCNRGEVRAAPPYLQGDETQRRVGECPAQTPPPYRQTRSLQGRGRCACGRAIPHRRGASKAEGDALVGMLSVDARRTFSAFLLQSRGRPF